MKKEIKEYLSEIGSRGGKKSKRTLTSEQARRMVEIREQKKLSHAREIGELV
jgi:DNA polymerase III delta prime subunit